MKLELGVENVAYSDPDAKGATTTAKVAEILEDKYHVMQVFYQLHEQEIGDEIARTVANNMDALLQGERVPSLPFAGADQKIAHWFRNYLDSDEWQKTSGQVIAAAQNGVSHRFKKPRAKRGPRVAFVDTGLYQASFRAQIK